eukprot:tig00020603_g11775.t1
MLCLRLSRALAAPAAAPLRHAACQLSLLRPGPVAQYLALRHVASRNAAASAEAAAPIAAANAAQAATPAVNAAEVLGARTTRRKRKATRVAEKYEAEGEPVLMKVFALNTAERYQLERIVKWSPTRPPASLLKDLTESMYYAKVPPRPAGRAPPPTDAPSPPRAQWSDNPLQEQTGQESEHDVFYFDNGTVVLWGFDQNRMANLVRHLGAFEELPLKVHVVDDFEYRYGQEAGISDDVLVLATEDENLSPVQQKLAFSIALSRSVKLDALEEKCHHAVAKVRDVPRDLEEDESAPLHRRAALVAASILGTGGPRNSLAKIMSVMREVMQARGELNLYADLTEDPESYWNNKAASDLLRSALHHLEIYRRKKGLNEKLEYSSSLLQIVWSHHSEQRSLRLEWIIIILIAIEVVFGTIQLVKGGGPH